MRRLIAVALLLVAAPVLAKKDAPDPMPTNGDGTEYEYTGTVEVGGATADQLYGRARAWAAGAYPEKENSIHPDNAAEHRLIIRGVTKTPWMGFGVAPVRHTLTIETKDGRYRYKMTDFLLVQEKGRDLPINPDKGFTGKKGVVKRTQVLVEDLIASLLLAMEAGADDDW